jgi:ADP-ribose pyrophosphatase YjhB (NUDIX family)
MAEFSTEEQFLEHHKTQHRDSPLTTVDITIFTVINRQLQVLLVKRAQFPAKGKWALPGGAIDLEQDTCLADTARRKLREKTGIDTPYLEQVGTVGTATRDPRGWSTTVTYFALLSHESVTLDPDPSSEQVEWMPFDRVQDTPLAFDHSSLLQQCFDRLRNKVRYTALPVNLMPASFTLTELQTVFEIILGQPIAKKAFRRRLLEANILAETGDIRTGSNRPAKLYKALPSASKHFFVRGIEGPRQDTSQLCPEQLPTD